MLIQLQLNLFRLFTFKGLQQVIVIEKEVRKEEIHFSNLFHVRILYTAVLLVLIVVHEFLIDQ